jgi:(4S)-4-hydroxy-5-phosphonooxypentane-2,3-dione isomerase
MMPRSEAGGKNMSRIMIVVEFEVKPEHKNALIDMMTNHARLSRAEDGCQQFDVLLPVEEPNKIMLVEAWRDQAALGAHSKQPRMAQNRSTYTPWLTARKATRCTAD